MAKETATPDRVADLPPKRIPRSCSDVFRLWAAVGLGVVLTIGFELAKEVYEALGLRSELTATQRAVEEDFGANLIAWVGFAIAYLWLGVRAFRGVDHAELVRRIKASPLPQNVWKRWLLAGGGTIVWPLVISVWAFSTVVTAVLNKDDVPPLVLTFAGLTVLSCVAIITFSFALHYARTDIAVGGLDFAGADEPVFSDYFYMSAGCTVTFGSTDTTVTTSSMRRFVTFHSVLAWVLNTIVIATMVSLAIN